jgi:hypothetical protein
MLSIVKYGFRFLKELTPALTFPYRSIRKEGRVLSRIVVRIAGVDFTCSTDPGSSPPFYLPAALQPINAGLRWQNFPKSKPTATGSAPCQMSSDLQTLWVNMHSSASLGFTTK